jgi:type II secretory pathway pseudopilin PulG
MKQIFKKLKAVPASRCLTCAWIRPELPGKRVASELGFSLLEAVIAMLLMTIVALGSASLFSYSIYNNSGASDRNTSIAIAREALELLRTAQFNSTGTAATLAGGQTSQNGIVRGRRTFNLTKKIDDDPNTNGDQINAASNFKTITITVTPSAPRSWAVGVGGTVTLITQRSRTDR